jgi:hypothetical protein
MKINKNSWDYGYHAEIDVPINRIQSYSVEKFQNGWEVYPVCSSCGRVQTPVFKTKYLKDAKAFLLLLEQNLNALL